MPRGDVETYYELGTWQSRREAMNEVVFGMAATKEEAVRLGRERAIRLGVEHIIKNQDGTIGQKNSYGNDPRDIPG